MFVFLLLLMCFSAGAARRAGLSDFIFGAVPLLLPVRYLTIPIDLLFMHSAVIITSVIH